MKIKLLCIICIFLLPACTSLLETKIGSKETIKYHAASLNKWRFNAKMSIQSPAQSGIVSLLWQQDLTNYKVDISSPLSQGWLQLKSSPERVTLLDSDGKEEHANNANILLIRHGFWHLPIEQFRYWLKGVAAPGPITDIQFSSDKTIRTLSQNGWHINYETFTQVSPMLSLPRKLTLEGPKLKIKLIIKQWEI